MLVGEELEYLQTCSVLFSPNEMKHKKIASTGYSCCVHNSSSVGFWNISFGGLGSATWRFERPHSNGPCNLDKSIKPQAGNTESKVDMVFKWNLTSLLIAMFGQTNHSHASKTVWIEIKQENVNKKNYQIMLQHISIAITLLVGK